MKETKKKIRKNIKESLKLTTLGFTLVELLAVIVILAIILVIAVPKIMSVIEDSKKATLESTAKMIASSAEKAKVQNTVLGKEDKITCDSVAQINKTDYESCSIEFNDSGEAEVTIAGSGKFEGLWVCNGTKTNATATEEECTGGGVPVLNCTYDGELEQGAEFVHNQYTYRYMQEATPYYGSLKWENIDHDGWGVALTDLESTEPVNTPICTYINGKPIVSMKSMFYNSVATSLDLSSWNTSNVTNMGSMFSYSATTSLDLSSFDTSNVTNMGSMFEESAATSLDLSSFDTSNVTNMGSMFEESAATTLDLSSFDTSNVTDMESMFEKSAATALDLSSFDTSNVTDMESMFSVSAATTLDLSSFDTSNVTDMYNMFDSSAATSLDLSSFDTSNVTNMSAMFASSAATSLDLSNFDTSNVTDMESMFSGSAATTLDLSSFDTSNVTDMYNMFGSSAATSLDLSSFDTSNVTNMGSMFAYSVATTIYVGDNWNTSKASLSAFMFTNATNLVGGNGTAYNDSNPKDKTYARVDTASTPGYFTYKANN